jgi:hypothetical protein
VTWRCLSGWRTAFVAADDEYVILHLTRDGRDGSGSHNYGLGLWQNHISAYWPSYQSREVAFVVHTLMQDANDVDTVCRMSIKQNVRSGRIHAVASAHFGAFPA